MSINVIRFAGLSQNGDIVADITPMTFSAHESMGRSIPSSYQQYDPAERKCSNYVFSRLAVGVATVHT